MPRKRGSTELNIPDDALEYTIQGIVASCVREKTVVGATEPWLAVKSMLFTNTQFRRVTLWCLENSLPLSPAQFAVFLAIVFGKKSSICCVGSAGTGKSFTVRLSVAALRAMGRSVESVAPTRRTAAALDGCTVAKFIGLRPKTITSNFTYAEIFVRHPGVPAWLQNHIPGLESGLVDLLQNVSFCNNNEQPATADDGSDDDDPSTEDAVPPSSSWVPVFFHRIARSVASMDAIVLDEFCMLGCFRFEQFVSIVRKYCDALNRPMPTIVLLGDGWQTEPFSNDSREINEWPGKVFAFETPTFKSMFGKQLRNVYELKSVKRSSDPIFHGLLFRLRSNKGLSRDDVRLWHEHTARPSYGNRVVGRLPRSSGGQPVTTALVGRHVPAKWDRRPETNACRTVFDKLVGESTELEWREFHATDVPSVRGQLPRRMPATLRLCIGILVTVPDPTLEVARPEVRVHARILEYEFDSITVETLTGMTLEIKRTDEVGVYGNGEVGHRIQFDIKPSPALTTHSSQGMTFGFPHAVFVEKDALWSRNMVFTALSRSTSMQNITLCGSMGNISCKVSQALLDFQRMLDERMAALGEKDGKHGVA